MGAFNDLTGKRFNMITVMERADNRGKKTYWKCRCDCGNIVEVRSDHLSDNHVQSCGCISEQGDSWINDISGKRFGKLTVLNEHKRRNGKTYWHCMCDCGNDKWIRYESLMSGKTISCSCHNKSLKKQYRHKENDYRIYKDYVEVVLHSGNSIMLCDIDDWERLKKYSWRENKSGYAVASMNDGKVHLFHRVVLNTESNDVVDHINRNRLDNRKSNLRICSVRANSTNVSVSKRNKSGTIGVYPTDSGKWSAKIGYDGTTKSIGTYETKEEAIVARKEAEKELFSPLFSGLI